MMVGLIKMRSKTGLVATSKRAEGQGQARRFLIASQAHFRHPSPEPSTAVVQPSLSHPRQPPLPSSVLRSSGLPPCRGAPDRQHP